MTSDHDGSVGSFAPSKAALSAARDPGGPGAGVFTRLYPEAAMRAARTADQRRKEGRPLSAIDGQVVSIKDLFDVQGETTLAGSTALHAEPPARSDVRVVALLKAAGAVVVGKTNMTEFALRAGAQSASRNAAEPVATGGTADRRRIFVGRRRLGRRGHGLGRHRDRYGRIGPHPRGLLRSLVGYKPNRGAGESPRSIRSVHFHALLPVGAGPSPKTTIKCCVREPN
jgi:hypothetical protein